MSDNTDDSDMTVLACMRCEDTDLTTPDSERGTCSVCNEAVWFDRTLFATAEAQYGRTPVLRCLHCHQRDIGEPLWVAPEQIADMLAIGQTPRELAYVMALAEVSAGRSPEDTAAAVLDAFRNDWNNPLCRMFATAFQRASVAVDEAYRLYQWPNGSA